MGLDELIAKVAARVEAVKRGVPTFEWAEVASVTPPTVIFDSDATNTPWPVADVQVAGLTIGQRVEVRSIGSRRDVVAPAGGATVRPNILINGDFRVNQRKAVSGASVEAGAYCLDRWKNFPTDPPTALITWADVGGKRTLTLGGGGSTVTITQVIERTNMPAGTYTLSWEGTSKATLYGGGAPSSFAASPVTVTTDGSSDMTLRVGGNGTTLANIKVEAGPNATPFTARTYGEELVLCQRYYQRRGGQFTYERFGLGAASSTTNALVGMPLSPSMRVPPALSYGGSLALYDHSTIIGVSSIGGLDSPGVGFAELRVNATGLTSNRPYVLLANGDINAYVAFNAEL